MPFADGGPRDCHKYFGATHTIHRILNIYTFKLALIKSLPISICSKCNRLITNSIIFHFGKCSANFAFIEDSRDIYTGR